MRTPYTFGQVTSANATGFTVRFNESRYPFASNVSTLSYLGNASWLRAASHIYGAIDRQTMTPQLPMQWGGSGSISLGPGSGVLTVAYGRLSPQFVGEWLVLEHSREHTAFEFTHCGDVEIEGVSLRSNPGFGLMFNRCRDVALDGVELVAAGGRPMSIMADGAHFRQCSGRILVQNSRFERNGDDGFAVHGAYYQVTAGRCCRENLSTPELPGLISAVLGPTLSRGSRCWLRNGIAIAITTTCAQDALLALAFTLCFVAVCCISRPGAVVSPACVILSGRESLDVVVGAEWEIRERMTMQVLSTSLRVASVDMSTSQVCFDASLPNALQPYDLLASLSRPSEVLIRNSTFWGNLGHGVRIKTDNATVTRCRLGYNSYMPILMIPDGAIWMSSGTVRNATVSHCYLERGGVWANAQYDVDATSITVTAYVPQTRKTDGTPVGSGPLASGMVNADIIIANNTVVQAPGVGTAFLFRATRNYAVVGNIVTWDATHAGNRLVHALNSLGNATSNICVSGNATMPC